MSQSGAPADILELGAEKLRLRSQEVPDARMNSDGHLLEEYSDLIATLEDFRRKNGFGRYVLHVLYRHTLNTFFL
jgi:hypothetical protein